MGRDFLSALEHFRRDPEALGKERCWRAKIARGGERAAAMLTPAFELSQDPDFLTVAIRVPHARVSELDVYFHGADFRFYAKPYFLRRVAPRPGGSGRSSGRRPGSGPLGAGRGGSPLSHSAPGERFLGVEAGCAAGPRPAGSRSLAPRCVRPCQRVLRGDLLPERPRRGFPPGGSRAPRLCLPCPDGGVVPGRRPRLAGSGASHRPVLAMGTALGPFPRRSAGCALPAAQPRRLLQEGPRTPR